MNLILAQAVYYFAEVLYYLILIRIIISWIRMNPNNPVMQILYMLTEPILGPIRRLLSRSPLGGAGMMFDLSPIIAMILINFVSRTLINLLRVL